MKISCPTCDQVLPAAQINVAKDVAVCPYCDEAFSISALVSTGQETGDFDIHEPPPGASFEDTGTGWRIRASTRSPIAFFLVPFMCVWSGGSLGGIYGTQIFNGEFNLLLSLFGIPFLLGTLLFGSIAVMSVCGRVVVSTDRNEGSVFAGVGPLGWTRRFDWNSITSVEESNLGFHSRNNGFAICLDGQSRLKFGSMLSEWPRRYYVLQSLRKLLASAIDDIGQALA